MDSRITEKDFNNLLLSRFGDPQLKFIKADFKPISESKKGFMGEHLKLRLIYSKNGEQFYENFFVKTKPFDITKNHPVNADNVYDKEIFFYDFLIKEFAKFGYETNFVAKSYLCINGETLIMEDLTEKGFHLAVRLTYFDTLKVKALLKSLALLHAGGFCYEKTMSEKTGKPFSVAEQYPEAIKEIFFTQYTTGKGFGIQWFKSSIQNFKDMIDVSSETTEYKEKFKTYLDQAEVGKIFVEDHRLNKTITHGDLWSNNLMFKKQLTTELCCLLDYQVCRYFYPAYDVLLATHFNTNEEFCKNHLQEMYQYYYDTFSETVKKYGYTPEDFMPYDDFVKGLEICKMDAMIQIASVNSLCFIPSDFADRHVKEKEGTTSDEVDGVEEQITILDKNLVPLAFKTCDVYQKAIMKNLNDLHIALEQKYK